MKITRSTAVAALCVGMVLALAACSSGESTAPEPTTVVTDDSNDSGETGETEETDGSVPEGETADAAATCEEFNTLSADLRAVEPGDTSGYDDIYLRSEMAKMAAPEQELSDLFAVMSLLALEAGSGDDTSETMMTLGDAVFAAAGICTAEGVTLTIS